MSDCMEMVHLESVDRISRLPVVEQTVDLATHFYERVKQSNLPFVSTVLGNAEATVRGAVSAGLPVAARFEGPLKTVDAVLCSSLDFVEDKLPAVKLPPEQIYQQTKDYVYTIPGVKLAIEKAAVVGTYGAHKIAEIKENLEQQQEKEKEQGDSNKDNRQVIPLYVYLSIINILSILTSWAGLNEENDEQLANGTAPTQNTENNEPTNDNESY